jgi:hypothetical protein
MINLSNCRNRGWQVLLVLLGMTASGLLAMADDLSRAAAAAPAASGSWSVTDPMALRERRIGSVEEHGV